MRETEGERENGGALLPLSQFSFFVIMIESVYNHQFKGNYKNLRERKCIKCRNKKNGNIKHFDYIKLLISSSN